MEERQRRERMWRRTEVYWHGAQSRSSLRPFSSTDSYICQCSIWFLFLSSLRLLLWIATVSSHILSLESILLSSLSLSFSYPCFPFAFGRVLLYRLSQYQVRDVWSRFNSDTNAFVLREETNYIPCKKRRMQTCFLERSRRGEDFTCRFVAWRLVCIVLLSKKQWLPLLWRNFEMQHRCVDYDAGEDHNNIHSVTQSSPAVAPVSDGWFDVIIFCF